MTTIFQFFHLLSLTFCCIILSAPVLVTSQSSIGLLQHPKLVQNIAPGSDIASNLGTTNSKAYIIRLDNTAASVASTVSNLMNTSVQDGGQIRFIYEHVFHGFSVSGVSNERMIEILDDSAVVVASRVRKNYYIM
jgi:hypothetical protein